MTAPEWRRTTQTGAFVANFKVASTARRFDRDANRWIDGHSLRVRVTCWRRLAEGVASSVMLGDPVVVVGRLYTRDWTDTEGNVRVTYEMEAAAVGHDLNRGRARFARNRPTVTTTVEDAETESRVRGEATEPVAEGEAPARAADHPFDDMPEPDFSAAPISPVPYDALATIRGGRDFEEELSSITAGAGVPSESEESDEDEDDSDDSDETAPTPSEASPADAGTGRRRGRSRTPVPA